MGDMTGVTAGLILTLIMSVIVAGVVITNVNTDAILGSTTTSVTSLQNIVLVAFTILAVGIIAFIGKYIIDIFQN